MERLEGGAKKKKKKHTLRGVFWRCYTHIACLHPESRDGTSDDWSAVEYKVCVVVEGNCGEFFFFFFGCTKLFGLPKRCTVAELLHIAYDGDNDLLHIGIILLCEVLAPSLLNMHECLK